MAQVSASGGPYGGSLSVFAGARENSAAQAVASAQFDEAGTYVLIGGVGTADIDLAVDYPDWLQGNSAFLSCAFAIDEVSQSCDQTAAPLDVLSFTVEYGVPFSMSAEVYMYAAAVQGEETDGLATYSLDFPGQLITPEPSSILLLMSGLGGVLFAARSRCKRSICHM